jgi:hypothetical protein
MSDVLDTGLEPVETPLGGTELALVTEFECPEDESIDSSTAVVQQLTATLESIRSKGMMDLNDVMTLESISPGILMDYSPQGGWSSITDREYQIAMEMSEGVMAGIGIAAAIALAVLIKKLIDKIRSMWSNHAKAGTYGLISHNFHDDMNKAVTEIHTTQEQLAKLGNPRTPSAITMMKGLNTPYTESVGHATGSTDSDTVAGLTAGVLEHLHTALSHYAKLTGRSLAGKAMFDLLMGIDSKDLPLSPNLLAMTAMPILFAGSVHTNVDRLYKYIESILTHGGAQLDMIKDQNIHLRELADKPDTQIPGISGPYLDARKVWLGEQADDFMAVFRAQFTITDALSADQSKMLLSSLTDPQVHARTDAIDINAEKFMAEINGKYELVDSTYEATVKHLEDARKSATAEVEPKLSAGIARAKANQSLIRDTLITVKLCKDFVERQATALKQSKEALQLFAKNYATVTSAIEKAQKAADKLDAKSKESK